MFYSCPLFYYKLEIWYCKTQISLFLVQYAVIENIVFIFVVKESEKKGDFLQARFFFILLQQYHLFDSAQYTLSVKCNLWQHLSVERESKRKKH